MEVVASLSQGRTAAAQCGFFTYKSVLAIFETPCTLVVQLFMLDFFYAVVNKFAVVVFIVICIKIACCGYVCIFVLVGVLFIVDLLSVCSSSLCRRCSFCAWVNTKVTLVI